MFCLLCLRFDVFSLSPGDFYQFERQAFFVADRVDSTSEKLVFNRTVTLRESKAPAPAAKPAAAKAAKAAKPAAK